MIRPLRPLIALTICFAMVQSLVAGKTDGRLDIYWIDVEGGAATLIITPAGESVLIDTGNPGLRDPSRIAKVINEVARVRGVDHLITTHYHRDHYGGAAQLATMLPIKTVYDNGIFDGMPDNPGKAYFEFKSTGRKVVGPGDTLPLKQANDSQIQPHMICLGTRQEFIAPDAVEAVKNEQAAALHKPKDRDGSDNANSVVMLLSYGPFQFYDGGDLTWNQEKRLVHPFNLVGEVDVYQVTHHGLDSSNNPIVLQSLKPRVAIMNNGDTKGCTPEVFANLKATQSLAAIYQVHKNLRPDGKTNNVADEFIANFADRKTCRGHYIKLSVAPDGESYTIAIPAHGHEREYKTK